MKFIDLNCDMGESPETIKDGTQQLLMSLFTSINVACGGHAGTEKTMAVTIRQAASRGVAVGAHPGYPDRANFGRVELDLPSETVSDFVFQQVSTLAGIAAAYGVTLKHVKPHGALYNQAVHNHALAAAVAQGVARWSKSVTLVGLAGSSMLDVYQQAGFAVAAEAFADRRYEPDGSLRSRKFADALITDPAEAAAQALRFAREGTAQTICVHGDTPGAVEILKACREALG